jgi:two-component system LytT family response regulator
VDWLDVADNYLGLHVGPKTHLWRGTMKQAEEELDPDRFVRIHRSAIVAVDRIVTVRTHDSGGHVIEIKGGVQLRSSRQYADRVRALLR